MKNIKSKAINKKKNTVGIERSKGEMKMNKNVIIEMNLKDYTTTGLKNLTKHERIEVIRKIREDANAIRNELPLEYSNR